MCHYITVVTLLRATKHLETLEAASVIIKENHYICSDDVDDLCKFGGTFLLMMTSCHTFRKRGHYLLCYCHNYELNQRGGQKGRHQPVSPHPCAVLTSD